MIELKGKYCKDCIIFNDNIEDDALSLIYTFINHPVWENQTIRIMPDVHLGNNIVIGFTGTYGDYVNPEHIGGDIGCSISSYITPFTLDPSKYSLFEHRIRKQIKFGVDIQDKKLYEDKDFYKFINKQFSKYSNVVGTVNVDEKYITKFCKRVGITEANFYKSIGSVGGGNHFVEIGVNNKGKIVSTVHCGSRSLGQHVCKYWTNIAKNELPFNTYLTGDDLNGYLSDLILTQAYAQYNHQIIHQEIYNILSMLCKSNNKPKFDSDAFIFTMHNYIDFANKVIHKGSIQALNANKIVIPFNMRDGLAICEGLSNSDWLNSAPHGCGRKLSRNKAKQMLSIDEFKKQMNGIVSTSVSRSTLDEAPDAYKTKDEIVNIINGVTVNVIEFIKPVINCKSYTSDDNG